MRKTIIRVLTFLLTLFIGFGVYYVWHFSVSHSALKVSPGSVKTSPESILNKVENESTISESEFYKIAPCSSANSFEHTPSWKSKGTILGGVVNGRVLCGHLPEYPPIARNRTISGVVTVHVLIDEIGEVAESHALSGHPLLRQAAVRAAYQTRFPPTLLGGEVVKLRGVLIYKFDIERGVWLQRFLLPNPISAQ